MNNSKVLGVFLALIAGGLLLLAVTGIAAPFMAVERSAQVARQVSAEHAEQAVSTALAEAQPPLEGEVSIRYEGGIVVMSAEEFADYTAALNAHSAEMADKVVSVARSADAAQGAAAVAQSGAQSVSSLAVLGLLAAIVVWFATRGGEKKKS
jgi:hypothetical protein